MVRVAACTDVSSLPRLWALCSLAERRCLQVKLL